MHRPATGGVNYIVVIRGEGLVVLAPAQTVTHATAASVAAAIHMHYEGEVVETPLASFAGSPGLEGIAVLAANQGLVEYFPASDQALPPIREAAAAASAAGWRVAVLVPSDRMGDAHSALRGCSLHLQAWWTDGDRICFGGPEVP